MIGTFLGYVALGAGLALAHPGSYKSTKLPVVDLGYERHQALTYNSAGDFYNFSNIRYAAPPVDALRWRPPQRPTANKATVQVGSERRVCPPAHPGWQAITRAFILCLSNPAACSNSTTTPASSNTAITLEDPTATEDCLFLDVVAPRKVFESKKKGGAPVLVWIHGGGFANGHKSEFYGGYSSPAGLLKSAGNDLVFVGINYRLGVFGWLAGPTLQADGTANVGLLDQRFALDWVQKNIHKFGGDPKRVTVIGESAGASSIMHHLTAYGGTKPPLPFSRAILQSPAFYPIPSAVTQESTLQTFLSLLNVSSLSAARTLPSLTLQLANTAQILASQPYGTFTYGPAVDGSYVPALPGQLLLAGKFDKSVQVMAAHNTVEGFTFSDPRIRSDAQFDAFVAQAFPVASAGVKAAVTGVLYPPVYDGSFGYTSPFERTVVAVGELVVSCNADSVARAYGNQTFDYLYSVPPGFHALDVAYTFYNGSGPAGLDGVANVTTATTLQGWITGFVKSGNPGSVTPGGVPFPRYGVDGTVVNLNQTFVSVVKDPARNPRCVFWEQGLYA